MHIIIDQGRFLHAAISSFLQVNKLVSLLYALRKERDVSFTIKFKKYIYVNTR